MREIRTIFVVFGEVGTLCYHVRPTTREVLLDSCPDSYYNININLGEKADDQKKIVKFVLRHFKSVTVHLVGRLHQVTPTPHLG